mgnify:CR=1 FL=1
MQPNDTLAELIAMSRTLGNPALGYAILGEGNSSACVDDVAVINDIRTLFVVLLPCAGPYRSEPQNRLRRNHPWPHQSSSMRMSGKNSDRSAAGRCSSGMNNGLDINRAVQRPGHQAGPV